MFQSAQTERVLNSVRTEVLIQGFADRFLVLVTQVGKVGNLIQATIPATVQLPSAPVDTHEPNQRPLPPPPPSIELTPLLGHAPSPDAQPLYSLYAAQIATLVWTAETERGLIAPSRPSVIVGLALRKAGQGEDASNADTTVFHGVMDMVRDLLEQREH
ncbi:hypothetical protein BV25DRAFT_1798433 [Artomyces pyxidatus]|uniref:Uncharacterized protein n=1 Tax=Artomyces pyxidatus TaxID=48021 RepID=A0ACB8TAS3_9AGAM|nr:hypothetical protein BV25DRAFT_1798433 [Artomyces pyxidatus]